MADAVNGLLVARWRIQPIVATLILMVAGRGIAQLICGGQVVIVAHANFEFPAIGFLSGLPVAPLLAGTLLGVLIFGAIQAAILFDGRLSSWWMRIMVGALLLAFILWQKVFGGRKS